MCISSITIHPSNITITKGEWYYDAYAEVCPTNAACNAVEWFSSNPNIASVNSYGEICGVEVGSAVIYALAQDGSGKVGFCNVTVTNPINVRSIEVYPSERRIILGKAITLVATVCPENATDRRVRWTSSDSSIAEVDYSTGRVVSKTAGTVEIYATAVDGSGVYGTCVLTIEGALVSGITINPSSLTMATGASTILTATVMPEHATNKTIVWSSNDPNIATVDANTGYVEAKSPGTTQVWAVSQDGSGEYMNCPITVGTPISKISINPPNKVMAVGSSTTLTAVILPENAINKTVVWSSNDPNIATVDENTGYVEAKSPGTTQVWAVSQDGSGKYMNCPITVQDSSNTESSESNENNIKNFLVYNGKNYDIFIPNYSNKNFMDGWSVTNVLQYSITDISFDWAKFVIDLIENPDDLDGMATGSIPSISPKVSSVSAALSLAYNAFVSVGNNIERNDINIKFSFQEKSGQHRVVITLGSTEQADLLNQYAGTYIRATSKCNTMGQVAWISADVKDIYEELTGNEADGFFSIYDILITVDKDHLNSNEQFYLWMDENKNLIASPIVYAGDSVKIVKGLFAAQPLLELPINGSSKVSDEGIQIFNQAIENKNLRIL